jgi:hypothetical protein
VQRASGRLRSPAFRPNLMPASSSLRGLRALGFPTIHYTAPPRHLQGHMRHNPLLFLYLQPSSRSLPIQQPANLERRIFSLSIRHSEGRLHHALCPRRR